jgi:hypothetical protein
MFLSSSVCLILKPASRRKQEQKPTSNEVHHRLIIFVQQLLVFSPQRGLEVRLFFVLCSASSSFSNITAKHAFNIENFD